MDKVLMERWNVVVPADGLVVHVGDFMMNRHVNRIEKARKLLNGKIVLVRGNHDPEDPDVFKHMDPLAGIFDAVCDLLYLSVRESRKRYRSIMVSHFAMRVWHKSHFNEWHVYGHSHGTLPPQGKSYDVGVDNNDYAPVSYADLRDIMANLPDNLNLVKR
jgi:calcineurin-like phosphoesterase family protein